MPTKSPPPAKAAPKSWVCTNQNCGYVWNYLQRQTCFKCGAARGQAALRASIGTGIRRASPKARPTNTQPAASQASIATQNSPTPPISKWESVPLKLAKEAGIDLKIENMYASEEEDTTEPVHSKEEEAKQKANERRSALQADIKKWQKVLDALDPDEDAEEVARFTDKINRTKQEIIGLKPLAEQVKTLEAIVAKGNDRVSKANTTIEMWVKLRDHWAEKVTLQKQELAAAKFKHEEAEAAQQQQQAAAQLGAQAEAQAAWAMHSLSSLLSGLASGDLATVQHQATAIQQQMAGTAGPPPPPPQYQQQQVQQQMHQQQFPPLPPQPGTQPGMAQVQQPSQPGSPTGMAQPGSPTSVATATNPLSPLSPRPWETRQQDELGATPIASQKMVGRARGRTSPPRRVRSHSARRQAPGSSTTAGSSPIEVPSQCQVVSLLDEEDEALEAAQGAARDLLDKDL